MQLNSITSGHWCKYCANQALCDNDDCKICFEKSFASSEKSSCWSDTNEKKPRDVFKNSNDKYFFDCDACKHHFDMQLAKTSNGHGARLC